MRSSSLKILFIALSAMLFLTAMPGQTLADDDPSAFLQADTTNEGCYSLDVVFLIDQSGSMSGYGGVPASDPKDQRKYAVEAVIDQLSDIALDRCPDAEHRIAVISYGSDAQIDLGFSNIDPATFDDAERIRELLKRNVAAKEMGQTRPQLAFELAAEIFDDLPTPKSGEIRKQVIIFISDGIPYGTGQNATEYVREMRTQISESYPFSSNLLKQEQCLDDLRERYDPLEDAPAESINACLELCPDAQCDYQGSTYIWMILLKSYQPYPQGLLDIYADIAASHAGELIELGQNRQEIPSTFRTILSELAGVKAALLQCGKFAVNPYLRKATLNIYKLDEELSVTLSYVDADGTRHEITQGEPNTAQGFDLAEYYAFGTNERYVLNYPYPGLWDLRADDCTGLDAYYEEVNITAGYDYLVPSELSQYDREPFYDAENPFYMEVQMLDDTGRVIEQADHQQFSVDVIMTVTDPDGTESDYEMEWLPEDAIFRAKAPLEMPIPGIYSIDVVGTTYKHEGKPAPLASESFSEVFPVIYELFRLEGAEFSVFPVTPFQIEILSPQNGEDLGPIHGTLLQDGWNWPLMPLNINPIPVQARIVGEDGNPLLDDLNDVLVTPATALTAKIAEGNVVITLIPDPSAPGLYTGEIRGFEGEGSQRLMVSLTSEYNDHFRPLASSAEVQFSRVDPLLNQAQFYKTVLGAVIALVALRILICILSSSNPVRGELVFLIGTSPIVSYPLGVRRLCGKNKRIIKKKELRGCPQLGVRKIRIKNQRRSRRERNSEDEVDHSAEIFSVSEATSSHPGIVITCWPAPKGRPFKVELAPNRQTSFGDISVIQVIFKP